MRISINMGPWLPVPAIEGGSTHRAWHRLALEFAAHGHEVKIISKRHPHQANYERQDGLEFIRLGGFHQGRSQIFNLSKDLIYALQILPQLPESDLLVIHDFWLPIFSAIKKRKFGKIVVIVGRYPRGQQRFYNGVDLFIPNSQIILNALKKCLPDGDRRCKLVSNPVDTELFYPVQKEAEQIPKRILFAGRLHPEKGLELLISAFRIVHDKFSNCELKIIGPHTASQGGAGKEFRQTLIKMAQNLPVHFQDPEFDPSKLAGIYRESDIFVYPSLAEQGESCPMAPLEAMASGIPVVVSNLSCFADIMRDKQNSRIFEHGSTDAAQNLANVLLELLESPEDSKQIISNALITSEQHSFPQIATQYLGLFNALVKEDI